MALQSDALDASASRRGDCPVDQTGVGGSRPEGVHEPRHPALSHPLFRGLDAGRLMPHLALVRVRTYSAGDLLASPDSRRPALNLVLSGRLCLFELTADGRRMILDFIE